MSTPPAVAPQRDIPVEPRSRSGLLRILGFWDGIAVIVGVIIGAGILRTPGIIAGELGRPEAIFGVWILGALVALASSLVFAELVALIPRVGGKYVYAREAFGPLAGFVTGWSEILSRGMAAAAKAVVVSEYVALLAGFGPRPLLRRGLAVLVALGFLALHWAGLRPARVFQNTATLLKVLILLGITAVGFAFGSGFRWEAAPDQPATTLGWFLAFALAFQVVTFTYYGYDEATKLAEEIHEPRRQLPRVLTVGILTVAAIYLLVNAAFLYVLTPAEMAGSPLVAADVAARVVGGAAGASVTAAALVVLLGSINVNFLSLPRVGLALAQDRLAPARMTRVSASGTPRAALLVASVVIVVAALAGSFQDLVLFIMWIALAVDGLVVLSVFRLRKLHPDWERPFPVPFYPVLPAFVLVVYAGILASIAIRLPQLALLAVAVLAALVVAGFVWIRLRGNHDQRPGVTGETS